tara:strand:- start:509 stop:916 length:408 start_codon:yes stop_codon:yes gene_type:complete
VITTKYKTKFQVSEHYIKPKRHNERNWSILEKENEMILFCKKEELLYCRECYVDGVGTRKLEKLIETNWGFDSRYKVVGYTKDRDGKVMRVFVNKYDDPEGDLVSESILWPPVLGQRSQYYYPLSEGQDFYYDVG